MTGQQIQDAVGHAVESLPGLDAGERQWVKTKALACLATRTDPASIHIPALVSRWAKLLACLERPLGEGGLEQALHRALSLQDGLTREMELLCRHLVRKAAATGQTEFQTVGDVFSFVLFTRVALEDGRTDLSLLHDLADLRAGQVAHTFTRNGEPPPSAQEKVWLHQAIFAAFNLPELSPFEPASERAWKRHTRHLAAQLRFRRFNPEFC